MILIDFHWCLPEDKAKGLGEPRDYPSTSVSKAVKSVLPNAPGNSTCMFVGLCILHVAGEVKILFLDLMSNV